MDQQISINNINLSGKNKVPSGTLRVSKNGFGWKNKVGKSVTVLSNEIQHAHFIKISKKYSLLSLVSSNGNFRFDGFDEEQVANVSSFVSKLLPQINLEKQVRSTKGWNWGDINIDGATLFFEVDGKVAFDLPLTDVNQAQVDKNDVAIVFNKDTSASIEGTQMVEMRFWVPNVNEGEKSTAEELHAKIIKNADPHSSSVSGIVTLEQMPIKTPRGKFDIEMFTTSLKLKGNQSSTIPYDTITRIASLPTIDEKDCMIILSLDPPLRRGHTNYNHVIIQFPYNDTLEVKLNITEEQKEKYRGLLEEEMSGKKSDVVKQLFKVITGHKFAKVGTFRSEDDLPAIRCSSKAHEGFLYPMQKNLFFLPTPATFISLSQISHIEFARVTSNNQSNRNFDLVIFMKAIGSSNPSSFIFNNIKKEEFPTLNKYLKEKKLVIRGGAEMEEKEKDVIKAIAEDGSDEEDEDFVGHEDDDDDDEEFDDKNQSIEHIDSQDDVTPEKPSIKSSNNKRKRSASPSSPSSRKKVKKEEKDDNEEDDD